VDGRRTGEIDADEVEERLARIRDDLDALLQELDDQEQDDDEDLDGEEPHEETEDAED
jgi:hypothetical protein